MSQWIRRGDIFYIRNDDWKRTGSEIKKDRPAIIVSNDVANKCGCVVEVVYLTSKKKKKDLPTHVEIMSTGRKSIALCEQVTPVAVERVQNWVGHASPAEMKQVDEALRIALGLSQKKKGKGQ